MAGAMRKMAVYLGLAEDDDERRRAEDGYYDDEYYDDAPQQPAPVRSWTPREPEATALRARRAEPAAPMTQGSVALDTRPHTQVAVSDEKPYRITTLHPRTYNEARTIGEHFREGVPVIINLTEMEDADAKRLVDFAAGLIFGLHGSIERVTAKVFLLSPRDVEVTAEDKQRIVEGGFFNQS
ncbi:MAG: cell division protein SepF [Actinomycetota bacterium]|jgi:cell division inhibitor SepF|nr:cell division protein SepF [Actinomycetota bacterium]